MPEAAKFRTDAGAIAFAKYYLATVNRVGLEPKVGVLEPLALPSCKTCRNEQKTIQSLVTKKAAFSGAQFVIGDARIEDGEGDKTVAVRVGQPATQIRTADGTVLNTFPRQPDASAVLALDWQGGWRVAKLRSAP